MKSLRLVLRYAPEYQHPVHRFMSESDAIEREWLVAWNVAAERGVTYALFYVVGDRERYEATLSTVETSERYDITPVREGAFYVHVRERDTDHVRRLQAALEEPSLVVVPPLAYRPNGVLEFDIVGEPEALEAFLDELPDGIAADVRGVGEYDSRPGAPTTDLTARQREALRAGVAVGYYEVPREGSVADVAQRLECAPSTASNHLRKAQARLVRAALGE